MTLDPNVKALLDQFAAQPAPKLWEMPVPDGRALYRTMAQIIDAQGIPIGKTENSEATGPAGPIPVRVYTPVAAGGDALPGLVFYHGGGFVIGDLETHDALCRTLANEAECRVIAVDYRLAPEHPFPAAAEDAFAALQWVEANASTLGVDPNRLAVAGDSAGGNLAAVVALMAAEKGSPHIAFQLLIYPVVDVEADTVSKRQFAEGYFLEKATMEWFTAQYVPNAGERADPRASPLLASDHKGLPPAYVVTAGFDPLRDEGKAYAEKLKAAGVEAVHVDYPGMIHGFFNMQGAVPGAKAAIVAAAKALKEALA